VEELVGNSMDENWKQAWIENAKVIRKLLILKNFGAYWNTDDSFLKYTDMNSFKKAFQQLVINYISTF